MKRRFLSRFGVLAAAGVLLLSAPVSPVYASSTVVNNVWGSVGPWGNYAAFSGEWQAIPSQGYWFISKLGMTATVTDGKLCPSDICDPNGWSWAGKAQFLTSSGSQVAVWNINLYHNSGCSGALYGSHDIYFNGCKTSFQVPYSAAKIKFTWQVWATVNGFAINAWSASKVVNIS
jgi:hypothetical protein